MFPVFFAAGGLAPSHHVLGQCLEGRRCGGLRGVQEGKGVAGKSHGGSSESETTRISGPRRSSGTNTGGRAGVNCIGGWPGEKKSLAFDQSHENIRNRTFSEPLS